MSESKSLPARSLPPAAVLDLTTQVATLLFVNGETTERLERESERIARTLGFDAEFFVRWGELTIRINERGSANDAIVGAVPAGVDMRKVTAILALIDEVCSLRLPAEAVSSKLDAIRALPPVSVARFAVLAGAGAAGLGVIFGATHLWTLVLIALSASAGGCLRRWLGGISRNLLIQPFSAALLAGVVGAIAVRLHLSSVLHLVAVCPCMVLVPGPHLLNGTLDCAHARISLGAARIGFAGLIILMICTGLLTGLFLGGTSLPVFGPSFPIPLGYDVIAAGIAVAAYGTFFAMPWRTLPIPMLIGMLAHAARWGLMSVAGASIEIGALGACLLVGAITAPIADRLRLPFAALAFASVVSLIPGVFLFRMAGGLVALVGLGERTPPALLTGTIADGGTAFLILLAMAFGLIVPKLCIDHVADLIRERTPAR
ncbi:MAG TPA: threonine/serine exporter family protein [Acetobacteraceae bacterium]